MVVLIGENLNDVDVPEDPILSGGSVRNVVSDGVSPRRQTTVAAEVMTVTSLELDQSSVSDRFPS